MKFYIESVYGYSNDSEFVDVMVVSQETNVADHQAHYLAKVPFSVNDSFLTIEKRAIELAKVFFKKASV